MNAPAPGWNPDPTGRHEYRYWDGGRWTDDVSDNGVTGNDPAGNLPAPGAGPGAGPAADPTAQLDPTRQFGPPTAGAYGAASPSGPPPPGGPGSPGGPPSGPYAPPAPGGFGGPGPGGPGSGPYAPQYGSGGQYPVTPPRKSGPSTGLIVGLAALAVAVIAGIAFLVTQAGNDDTTNAAKTSKSDTTGQTGSNTTLPGSGDSTTLPDSGGSGLPGGTGNDVEDAVKQIMVTEIEKDGYTHEQAECAAQAVLDQFGGRLGDLAASGDTSNPLGDISTEDAGKLLNALSDCGIKDFPGT